MLLKERADIDVDTNEAFTIRVVGDRSEPGVQAIGERTLKWNPASAGDLSLEIPVKVPQKIKKGDFTFYFTVKKK